MKDVVLPQEIDITQEEALKLSPSERARRGLGVRELKWLAHLDIAREVLEGQAAQPTGAESESLSRVTRARLALAKARYY